MRFATVGRLESINAKTDAEVCEDIFMVDKTISPIIDSPTSLTTIGVSSKKEITISSPFPILLRAPAPSRYTFNPLGVITFEASIKLPVKAS